MNKLYWKAFWSWTYGVFAVGVLLVLPIFTVIAVQFTIPLDILFAAMGAWVAVFSVAAPLSAWLLIHSDESDQYLEQYIANGRTMMLYWNLPALLFWFFILFYHVVVVPLGWVLAFLYLVL